MLFIKEKIVTVLVYFPKYAVLVMVCLLSWNNWEYQEAK